VDLNLTGIACGSNFSSLTVVATNVAGLSSPPVAVPLADLTALVNGLLW
jgi:hypothetical protein